MCLTENQHTVWEFPAQSTDQALADRVDPRRLDRGAQDPRTGGLEDGVDEAVKFEPRSRIRNLMASNRSSRVSARLRACCTVHSPVGWEVTPPRCVRRVPCSINTRTYGLFSSTVSTCGSRPRGSRRPGLPGTASRSGLTREAPDRCPRMQDLPHRGRRHGEAELRQLALNPAVSPQRILLRQPNDKACDARDRRRTTGLAPFTRVVLHRGQLAVPGQQRRGRHGKDLCPAPAGEEPRQRGEPHPVGRLVSYAANVAAQHRVLVPEHQQLSSLRPVAAEHQDSHAEYPARQQVGDLEQYPASQPSPRQACW